MPRSIHAAGCIRSSIATSASSRHIWISDEILDTALRSFSRCNRRYGSNVPGPLEARRRSTKRKNTSFAHHGFEAQKFDPSLLHGNPPQGQWWPRSLPQPLIASSSRIIPAWLFDQPQPPDSAYIGPTEEISRDVSQQTELENHLRHELEKCTSLKSIRRALNVSNLNLRSNRGLVEVALHRLLKLYWTDQSLYNEALTEFLSDPFFNPPTSRNHLVFVKELQKRSVTRRSWDSFILPAIENAIGLGLISADDLKQIVLTLPTIMKSCGLTSKLESSLPISDWHRLLTSIDQCQVLNMKDLGQEFRHRWSAMLIDAGPSTNVVTLLWRLQGSLKRADLHMFAHILIPMMKELSTKVDEAPRVFANLLSNLSPDQRGSAVLFASQKLVAATVSGETSKSELATWHTILSELCGKMNSFEINQIAWNEALSSSATLTPFQNLIVLAWTVVSLFHDGISGVQQVSSYGFVKEARAILHSQGTISPQSIVSEIISCIHSLALPEKNSLYQELSTLSGANISSLLQIHDHETAMEKFAKRDIRVLNNERFFHWAENNFPDALEEIARSINSNIPGFTRISRMLIMHDKTSMKIIRRILKYNVQLKLAASLSTEQAWSTSISRSKDGYFNRTVTKDSTKKSRFQINQRVVVKLINDLAMATAVTPVLGHRSAFRNVYWFYLWLHRHGAPIQRSMSRALWHAGVSRYGESGCPSAQMKFCLDKVREIEGSQTADLLLWNTGYRRKRATEMTTMHNLTSWKTPKRSQSMIRK